MVVSHKEGDIDKEEMLVGIHEGVGQGMHGTVVGNHQQETHNTIMREIGSHVS